MPSPLPRRLAVAGLAAGGVVTLIVQWPGTLVYDSYVQLAEARAGSYSFWHPPVMSWLLGLADALMPGAALYVTAQILIGFGALAVLPLLSRRVSWAALAAMPLCLLPQLLMYQGTVLKDVLAADAALAAFVALAAAAAAWRRPAWRFAGIAVAVLFLALTALARQNGVLFLPFAAVALGLIAARRATARDGLAYGAGLLAATAVCVLAANAALALRHDGSRSTEFQFEILRVYDMIGVLSRHPEARLDVLERRAPDLARAMRADGVRLYSPTKNDTLEKSAALQTALDKAPPDAIAAQWRALTMAHPWWWLRQRAEVFSWMVWPADVAAGHPFFVGEDGPAEEMAALGMHRRYDSRDRRLKAYGDVMARSPVLWHPLYAGFAIAALVLLLRRRRPVDLAMAGLLGGALAFAASFFVIGIACDYRYLYALDLAAIAAAIHLLGTMPPLRRWRVVRAAARRSA